MTGLEGIIQELRDTREAQVNVYREVRAYIEALDFMIAAGEQRLNGQVRGEVIPSTYDGWNHVSVTHHPSEDRHVEEPIARTNPFKEKTIKWYCFEVLKRVTDEMHVDEIHMLVQEYRQCSKSTVASALYERGAYFKLGKPGFFTLADA